MSLRRILLALGGVAAMLVTSMALVHWLTAPAADRPARLQAGAPGAGETALGIPGASTAGADGGGQAGPVQPQWTPPAAPQQATLPPPEKGSWDAVPIAPRATSMGEVGAGVSRELAGLQPSISACFDEDAQARHGAQAVSAVGYGAAEDSGSLTLLLLLETAVNGVRVADAPVETRGGASDGLIACAQAALRGRTLAALGARPGQRYRLRFPVNP